MRNCNFILEWYCLVYNGYLDKSIGAFEMSIWNRNYLIIGIAFLIGYIFGMFSLFSSKKINGKTVFTVMGG